MNIENFLIKLKNDPSAINFSETISIIDDHFIFTPTAFKNGDIESEAGTNSGSCKIFSFARRFNLDTHQTLYCFGDYYRTDVLQNPEGTDHQNIRNFMKHGWEGVHFAGEALQPK